MMIQNYADLTLDNMTLDATQGTNNIGYVVSTNNGRTTIQDTAITAKANGIAFDVCTGWGGYASNAVEVKGTSAITGDVEVSFYGTGTAPSLTLTSGTHTGTIVMEQGADQATITKASTYTQAAPEGYRWSDAVEGVQTLEKQCDHTNTTLTFKEVTWQSVSGNRMAIFTYICECGEEVDVVVEPEGYTDYRGWRTYYATNVTDGRTATSDPIQLSYSVTLDGTPIDTMYHWGDIVTLEVGSPKLWKVNGVPFVDGRSGIAFAITEDMVVTTEEATTSEPIAAVMVKMESTQKTTAAFNAKWTLPEGSVIDSVTIYRGYSLAEMNITTQMLIDISYRNGDYTLRMSELIHDSYEYACVVIQYTLNGIEQESLVSSVAKAQVK